MKIVRLSVPEPLLAWRHGGRTKCAEEGRCRFCDRSSSVRALTRHHLVPQRWFSSRSFMLIVKHGSLYGQPVPLSRWLIRDADANIIPLCEPCHRGVEQDEWFRATLRKRLATEEVALAIKLKGEVWFNDRYPSSASARRVLVSAA